MRFFLTGIVLIAFALSSAKAQTNPPTDSRLIAAHGQDFVNQLLANDVRLYEYLSWSLDHAYFVQASPKDVSNLPDFSTVVSSTGIPGPTVIDEATFNVLLYPGAAHVKERKYYKLGTTGSIIVFYSKDELAIQFNEFKGITYD